MPLKVLPFAQISESFLAFHQSDNGSMNWMLRPLILLTPDSTPRFARNYSYTARFPWQTFTPLLTKCNNMRAPRRCAAPGRSFSSRTILPGYLINTPTSPVSCVQSSHTDSLLRLQ